MQTQKKNLVRVNAMAICDEQWLLVVDGFMREQNELLELNVPTDINRLIYMFYKDIARYFDKYNKELFRAENANKRIVPIGPSSAKCFNYMIYPSPNGYDKGVHKWAVKYERINQLGFASYRSIGVTSKIDINVISDGDPWCDDTDKGSYWDARGEWYTNETIEIILDLDALKIEFYKIVGKKNNSDDDQDENENVILINKCKQNTLKPDTTYYFALCMDSGHRCCVFESELPQIHRE